MSTTFFHTPRRRMVVLGVVTFLLHWTALGWLNGQLGRRALPAFGETEMLAELLPAQDKLVVPPPTPLPLHTEPLPPPPPPPPAVQVAEADPATVVQAVPVAAPDAPDNKAQAAAPAAAPGVKSSAPAAPAPAPALLPAPPPAAPSYRVDLPPSANLAMDVDRVDADGTHWTGEADFSWNVGPNSYRIKFDVGIGILFAHLNLLELTSEGATGDTGFAPSLMTEKRRGRALTATHFNRNDGSITFSASQNKYPLAAGAQDKASVPLQLAAIARADPGQLKGGVDMQVGEDRDATVFHFVVLGQEDIDTRLGRLHAWHLSRPPKPGSYNARLDIWLAPERGWYPVRIRNTEASGAVTTQTVTKILMTGS
jgi:hypothetical protein